MEPEVDLRVKCIETARIYATNVDELIKMARKIYDYLVFDSLPSTKINLEKQIEKIVK